MDTQQLVDKFVNGEITEEQFDAEKSKLSPEQQEALKKESEARLPDAVEKLKGVRRGIDKIAEKGKDQETAFVSKVKQENFDAAKEKFFSEFGVKEEDRKAFEEGFSTESVNVENIIKDMKAHYVAKNPEKYLALEKQQKDAQIAAEEINAQNAGANGSGGGEDPTKKVSKEVKDFMEASRKAGRVLTPEQAERALSVAKNKGHIR